MITPFYESENVTLWHGRAEDVLPTLEAGSVDAVITDPVWPNTKVTLPGADDPYGLFTKVAALLPSLTTRLVVQLGCDSDPRFLEGVPKSLPFFRVCWLDYVRCSYKGRLLYTGDVAYAFGEPPPAAVGQMVIPGKCTSWKSDSMFVQKRGKKRQKNKWFTRTEGDTPEHPTPRRLQHVAWLVKWFGGSVVMDPFMGSGTTGVACIQTGRKFIGVECEESYCAIAKRRIQEAEAQPQFEFTDAPAKAVTGSQAGLFQEEE